MAKNGRKQHGRLKRPTKRPTPYKPQATLLTQGRHHDLLAIYDAVNRQYFKGKIKARITWGRKPSAPRRHHQVLAMELYYTTRRLIVIHRRLDRAWVPRFFLEYIVFHEILHIKYPPRWKNGRFSFHHEQFRAAEASFPDYIKAKYWEEKNLSRLLFF